MENETTHPALTEPVACLVETEKGVMVWPIADYDVALTYCADGQLPIKLYTAPWPREPLTVSALLHLMPSSISARHDGALLEFARAIESAHGIGGKK